MSEILEEELDDEMEDLDPRQIALEELRIELAQSIFADCEVLPLPDGNALMADDFERSIFHGAIPQSMFTALRFNRDRSAQETTGRHRRLEAKTKRVWCYFPREINDDLLVIADNLDTSRLVLVEYMLWRVHNENWSLDDIPYIEDEDNDPNDRIVVDAMVREELWSNAFAYVIALGWKRGANKFVAGLLLKYWEEYQLNHEQAEEGLRQFVLK